MLYLPTFTPKINQMYDASINAMILDGIRMLNVCWGKVILLRADSTILFLVVLVAFFSAICYDFSK